MRQTRVTTPNRRAIPPPRIKTNDDRPLEPDQARIAPELSSAARRQMRDGPPPRIRVGIGPTAAGRVEPQLPDDLTTIGDPPTVDDYFAPDQFFD
ncbi:MULTISPECIES: hypothetical protein [unclassified Pseudoclavibacter]|uniref:hypothetical protein n=1 Tax=unclassified Pseudoclavibacter TaxID=2615177 RepID=UPI00130126C4|nr:MULTISPECIES: hypothetical protein [unclassified Pseudoclavibacter]KAB1646315.1 hypothetical protein F8O06_06080 [Pseudoclavibacter sp. CFCC 14310]KAB1663523.1 hypothetical protein F8O08_07225 [Pseudoclavibacter sp. CFCC 13611]